MIFFEFRHSQTINNLQCLMGSPLCTSVFLCGSKKSTAFEPQRYTEVHRGLQIELPTKISPGEPRGLFWQPRQPDRDRREPGRRCPRRRWTGLGPRWRSVRGLSERDCRGGFRHCSPAHVRTDSFNGAFLPLDRPAALARDVARRAPRVHARPGHHARVCRARRGPIASRHRRACAP